LGGIEGYFDQSHFLRAFREFASAPARVLAASPMSLNRAFACKSESVLGTTTIRR